VLPAELQVSIATSFEMQCQGRDNAMTTEKVNQVILERAMEASIGRPVYGDTEWNHVYREAKMVVNTRNRHRAMMVS
jgi:hypothetical protein